MRVVAFTCGDCGEPPRYGEVNRPVVDRRRAVREVNLRIAQLGTKLTSDNLGDPVDELQSFVRGFIAALGLVISSPRNDTRFDELAGHLDRLYRVRTALSQLAGKRPTGFPRACLEVAQRLETLWPIYAEALSAPDLHSAQEASQRGQLILDKAGESFVALTKAEAAAFKLGDIDSEPSLTKRTFAALNELYEGKSFELIVQKGLELSSPFATAEIDAGNALDYLLQNCLTDVYFDPDAMRAKRLELRSVGHDRSRVVEIAAMTGAVQGLGYARRDLFECLSQFANIIDGITDDTVALRRYAKTVGELYEASLPLFVWMSLLTGKQSGSDRYQKLIGEDSTGHTAALAKRLPITFGDAPSFLRNSAHHGRAFDVAPDDGTVHIALRSYVEIMSIADYIDRSYAFIESILACSWIVSVCAQDADIDVILPKGAANQMGLAFPEVMSAWFSSAKGVTVRSSVVESDVWTFVADLKDSEIVPTAIVFASLAKSQFSEVRVSNNPLSKPALAMSLDEYDKYQEIVSIGDSVQTLLGVVSLRHSATLDGVTILTKGDVDFAVVVLVQKLMEGDLGQVAALRWLRTLAIEMGAIESTSLIEAALRALRANEFESVHERVKNIMSGEFVAPALPVATNVIVRIRSDA